jgi:polyphosphate kinase
VRQRRYEPVVRLEFARGADPSIREMLRERFALSAMDIYELSGELDYTSLFQIAGLLLTALRDPAWTRSVRETFWSIILMKASKTVWSASLRRLPWIRKRSQSR